MHATVACLHLDSSQRVAAATRAAVQVQLRSARQDALYTFCTAIATEKAHVALLNAALSRIMDASASVASVCKQLEEVLHEPDLQPDDAVKALELEVGASRLIELFGMHQILRGSYRLLVQG
jgi:hypothetical protein